LPLDVRILHGGKHEPRNSRLTCEPGPDGAYVTEPRNPEADLARLIRQARGGDASAFERLAGVYRDRIYRWALVRTGDEDDAEDATQEALVRLHRGLGRFDGRSRFETWLYAVVRSATADVRRGKRQTLRLRDRFAARGASEAAAEPPPVVEGLEARRVGELVRAFLESLPARQREAMDLVDLQGVGQAEAAARLGVSPATLRTHLFRARRTMRARLLAVEPGIEEMG
jgi:RNA polymerase sigma-70 factor (ECF subfamily)